MGALRFFEAKSAPQSTKKRQEEKISSYGPSNLLSSLAPPPPTGSSTSKTSASLSLKKAVNKVDTPHTATSTQQVEKAQMSSTTFDAEACLELCSHAETLKEGIKALHAGCFSLENARKSSTPPANATYLNLLQKAVILSLPNPQSTTWKDLDQLPAQDLSDIQQTLTLITEILDSYFKGHYNNYFNHNNTSGDLVIDEELESQRPITFVLLGYVQWQLTAATTEGKELFQGYTFDFAPFLKSIKTGVVLSDPTIHKKTLELVNFASQKTNTIPSSDIEFVNITKKMIDRAIRKNESLHTNLEKQFKRMVISKVTLDRFSQYNKNVTALKNRFLELIDKDSQKYRDALGAQRKKLDPHGLRGGGMDWIGNLLMRLNALLMKNVTLYIRP